jgi:16S rRNA (guanine527-N7)-methyltransferase
VTEEEARAWIAARYGPERLRVLGQYVSALLEANQEQNLISKSTEAVIWKRHILDSAQLERFAPDAGTWLDVGSGPGLPGIVLAILTGKPMLLVEPRRKRVEFLHAVCSRLGLAHVRIRQADVGRVSGDTFDAVTARAYAPLPEILSSTVQLTKASTIWILPKGRSAATELAEAQKTWHGVFHVEQSLSDEEARIIVATGVRRIS